MDEERPEKRQREEEQKPVVKSFQHLMEGKAELIAVNPVCFKVIIGNKRSYKRNGIASRSLPEIIQTVGAPQRCLRMMRLIIYLVYPFTHLWML